MIAGSPISRVEAAALRAAVDDRMQTAAPIGAFATDSDARYLFLDARGVETLSVGFDKSKRLPSMTLHHPIFDWDEREMRQEYGIDVDGHPVNRPLYETGGSVPPAFVAEGEGLTQIVVGPVHAGIIEPGRFVFSSGGETVVHLDAQLGYSRRGVERFLEGRDPLDAAQRIARICGGCSASRSYAYALAIERLAGLQAPEHVDLARLAICELERIYNHLADIAACASAAGWNRGFAVGMALKDEAMRANALASGHRLLFDAIVPGGVKDGVFHDRRSLIEALASLESGVRRFLGDIAKNASVVSRWTGTGIVPAHVAKAFGLCGPAGRASNHTFDVRCRAPYGAYRTLVARPWTSTDGDVRARCRVKRAEIYDSFRLLQEAFAQLGGTELPGPTPLAVECGYSAVAVEGARGSEIVAVDVGDDRRLHRFHATSASYRNWPLVAHAMEDNIVPDFPLVNKSFNLCYACADR